MKEGVCVTLTESVGREPGSAPCLAPVLSCGTDQGDQCFLMISGPPVHRGRRV